VQRLLPRVVPVPSAHPQPGGAVLLLYDVTDLVRLDELRSDLVAVASHELQTPLTTLRMTLLMLQEGSAALPQRQRELVATALIGVEQLNEVVHEFLDLTRIEAGELRLNLEPVHVGAVLGEAFRRVEGQAKAQEIAISRSIDTDLPPIGADPLRLRAVFANILANALKYTPSGGAVTIEAQRIATGAGDRRGSIAVRVCDTGPGIPEEFFRLEHHQAQARPATRGAGIGLYMCRQIVELHGGEIACSSGPGAHGTCITVTLPSRTDIGTPPLTDPVMYVSR
jgi:NtrC-family two-component system sensor histidine kinase KinB